MSFCQELVNHFSLSFSKLVLQFELKIFFILEDLETNCSVLLPGEDDMDDGMPELEDYSNSSVYSVAYLFAIYLLVKYSSEYS